MENKETLDELMGFFNSNFNGAEKYKKNICSAVKKVDELSGQQLANRILELINLPANNSKYIDPVGDLLIYAKELLSGNSSAIKDTSKESYVIYFRQFLQTIFGFFYANTFLTTGKNDDYFCELIANNALFASKDVVSKVKCGELGTDEFKKYAKNNKINNPFASWDYMKHCRDNKLKKNKVKTKDDTNYEVNKVIYPGISPQITVDDNTFANQFFKKAIIESYKYNHGFITTGMWTKFKDYETCHVWDKPGDRRYYASICNLTLIPRALAQLTDHNDAVKQLLRYRAWELFQFKPEEEEEPDMPKNYKKYQWRRVY